jgi:uncharacterized protein HemX
MLDFKVASHRLVQDGDIRTNIADLREIPAEWKTLDDPLSVLNEIKQGGKPQ